MEAKKSTTTPHRPASGQAGRPKVMYTGPSNRSKSTPNSHSASANSKGAKSADVSSSRPCPEHSFLTDVADVRQMEQGLLQLLDDFHSGKLQAFAGQDCTFDKMDQVREQQEKLARLHFDLDTVNELRGLESAEAREASNKKLEKLMGNLQDLCTSIQNLQKDYPAASGQS